MNSKVEGKLNSHLVLQLWTKTYNREGKPDWTHIFPYYSRDIIFQDTIQRIEGIADFKSMCKRLTKRCSQLNMEITSIAETENEILFEWVMTMVFKRLPSTPLYGSTRLTIDKESKISHQRDYYDLWGDIYNNIPIFGKIYRWFLRKMFG